MTSLKVGAVAAAGFIELLWFLGEGSWTTMAVVAVVAVVVMVLLRRHQQRFLISVSGIGLSRDEKVALRKELLRDPEGRRRIDAVAHGRSIEVARQLARSARHAG